MELNDFGFSMVHEEELETVRVAVEEKETLTKQLETVDNRAKTLYDAISPLLQNLKSNPERDYIFWPDRTSKIEAFEAKIAKIVNGE